ncbi:hypothetical protein BW723_11705 [Polaribacter reichenbachii]|uniref:Outer membrane protein beta-barrel domain-containing protein n=1 Tax=Polaribacter reichenbachii TaxID=996801 RepID=A0A1B8TQP7_9FLAO|nr:hypothetical protein [Polaribacter reichenbachii]APZ48139.1 hypothetical protein BW723_11705 [Polaribacter reichenbachii]AUC20406.1 hypothetical protein BTO17_02150 [Polaribacter reichenbachii]OBY61798.1 hypothetical protein LPB301_16070 [Polaribacter reichenbachii]
MKKFIFVCIFLSSLNNIAQEYNLNDLKGKELHNSIRLNYILIDQPDRTYTYGDGSTYTLDPNMGFWGLNYNIPLNDWLYTGAGFHGAAYGDQGGLFTLGVNLGVNFPIYKNLSFDANVHFGGGGGFRSLVNGGGLLYTNAGLKYDTKDFSFGLQYGKVDFFTGIQGGNNISFFVEIPTTLRTSSYANAQKSFIVNNENKDKFWKKPAVKNVQQVTFDYFFPIGSSRNDGITVFNDATPLTQTLSLLGFEYQRYLTQNTFIYAHVDAMYSGLEAGFMDVFFGIGKNLIETKYVNFFAKLGVGAAGGRIYPENGLTVYPNAGFDVKLTKNFGVSAHGGYHRAIGGIFEAYTAGFSLKYYGLNGGTTEPFTNKKVSIIKTKGIHIGVQNQTYFKVAKTDRNPLDLQLIAIKVLYDINHIFYLSGEASFAYEGESGGYAHGIFGIGIRSNKFINNKFSLFAETSAGVAGGAGVDTGEGILIRPTAGINYHLNSDLSFQISGGQYISAYGNVNSTNLNIGLTYSLSILNAKK